MKIGYFTTNMNDITLGSWSSTKPWRSPYRQFVCTSVSSKACTRTE